MKVIFLFIISEVFCGGRDIKVGHSIFRTNIKKRNFSSSSISKSKPHFPVKDILKVLHMFIFPKPER